MSMVKTTVRSERKLRVNYVCEKCKHKHSLTLNMPFQRVYYGSKSSVSENELDAQQQFKVEIAGIIDHMIKNTTEGNRKAMNIGACPECKYLQSWLVEREVWSRRYSYWLGIALGIIAIIISLFFLPKKGIPVFTIIGIIITPFLAIWMHFEGKKDAIRVRNRIDPTLKKRTPTFDIFYF
jgi:hypothetical protein